MDADLRLAIDGVDRRDRGRAVQPNTVYVGSGESTLRDSVGYGNGVYKSTDAGRTWTHLGLDETHHIGKIAIDPKNPDNVFVAAIGKLYAANKERGIFRSKMADAAGRKVLGDDNVGAVEVVIDPSNSNVVYAGLWNTRRPPWFTYAPTNGPGGGIFKSTDGGTTWTRLTNGLPKDGIGRTGIAIAPSNPNRIYAVVDCLVPEAPPQVEPPLGTPAATGARRRAAFESSTGPRRILPLRRRRRDVDATVERSGAVGTRLVLREDRRRSEGPGHRLRAERRGEPNEGRRQRPGSCCADLRAATTTIRRGSIPTTRTR